MRFYVGYRNIDRQEARVSRSFGKEKREYVNQKRMGNVIGVI